MKDGAELKEDSRISVNRENAGHGSYELVIHKVQDSDAGNYSAVATNTHGTDSSEAKIGVKGELSISVFIHRVRYKAFFLQMPRMYLLCSRATRRH